MAWIMRVCALVAVVLAMRPVCGAAVAAVRPAPPTPLFGVKPELYLSPTFGVPGDHIRIIGLGYRPRATVYVVFLKSEKSGFSLKDIQRAIKVRARVSGAGVFRATYRIGPEMDPAGALAVIYFAFATYDGDPHTLLAHKLAGTAFVVCALCLSR